MFTKQLIIDIIGYHFDPSTPPINVVLPLRCNFSFGSVLINKNHWLMIACWIDKKDKTFYSFGNFPYTFKLLYRASKDGFEAENFHKLCDNKGSTIMISKLQENGKLIGGYNPLSWTSFGFGSTSNSFLFSFAKKDDPNSECIIKVANNIEQNFAIHYNPKYGPAFGSGCDLKIESNNISRYKSCKTYPGLNMFLNEKNILEDYEVFQIIKNSP